MSVEYKTVSHGDVIDRGIDEGGEFIITFDALRKREIKWRIETVGVVKKAAFNPLAFQGEWSA